jgi:hypothetical protein
MHGTFAAGLLSTALVGAVPLGGKPVVGLDELAGTWTGFTANPGAVPYPLEITINNATAWSEWGVIGRVRYPQQGIEAPLQIFYGMDCKTPSFDGEVTLAGANPMDRCFTGEGVCMCMCGG